MADTQPLTLEQFGAAIKAKYPDYATVPDREIGQRMLEKYPEYKDRVQTAAPYQGRNVLAEGRASANSGLNGQGEGAQPPSGVLARLNQLLEPYAHPDTITDFARLLTLPVDEARRAVAAAAAMASAKSAATATKNAAGAVVRTAGKAIDVADPDLVSIASPRAGAALKKAQQVRDVLAKRGAAPETPPVATSPVETVSGGTPPPPSSPPAPVPASASQTPQAPSPDVLTRLSPATQASVSVPPATVANYPQKFLNEVAIQAKRQGVQLTDQEYAVAHALTQQGQTPTQAVAQIVSAKAWGQPLETPTPPRPDAAKAYLDLRTQGKTHQQAVDAIAAQEQLRQRLGTPSSATVKARVDERNATKRWPKE